jgi:hypothetical protein
VTYANVAAQYAPPRIVSDEPNMNALTLLAWFDRRLRRKRDQIDAELRAK